jgi:hypothetical protein
LYPVSDFYNLENKATAFLAGIPIQVKGTLENNVTQQYTAFLGRVMLNHFKYYVYNINFSEDM